MLRSVEFAVRAGSLNKSAVYNNALFAVDLLMELFGRSQSYRVLLSYQRTKHPSKTAIDLDLGEPAAHVEPHKHEC